METLCSCFHHQRALESRRWSDLGSGLDPDHGPDQTQIQILLHIVGPGYSHKGGGDRKWWVGVGGLGGVVLLVWLGPAPSSRPAPVLGKGGGGHSAAGCLVLLEWWVDSAARQVQVWGEQNQHCREPPPNQFCETTAESKTSRPAVLCVCSHQNRHPPQPPRLRLKMISVLICTLVSLSVAQTDLDVLYPELELSRTIYVTGESRLGIRRTGSGVEGWCLLHHVL